MIISKLIEELERELKREGDIECTQIGTVLPESSGPCSVDHDPNADVFESTICTLIVREDTPGWKGKRVLLCWQT